jgi:ubiquinone/menaquinone biosynthesis C-methylase UbiE
MFKPRLTGEPAYFDEYHQPCFELNQTKGLREEQRNDLLRAALADGYTLAVAIALQQWICKQVSLAACSRKIDLLEIGGGGGHFFDLVREHAQTYINIEPGRIVLHEQELARLSHPGYFCIKCSAEKIPLEDESVDVILSIASLDHIPDVYKTFDEISRLLRKTGVFIFTLNNRGSWWKLLLSRTNYLRLREQEIAKEHYFQWSYAECESNLSRYFTITRISTITFFPFVPVVWRYLLPVSDAAGQYMLHKYGGNILAVCQKRS